MPFALKKLIPNLIAGLVCGVLVVIYAIAFPGLIFSDNLTTYAAYGISAGLFSSSVILIVASLLSSHPGMISALQDTSIIATAVVVHNVTAIINPSKDLFINAFAVIFLCTSLTGLLLYLLGRFNLGSLVRFIPYPVMGGFLVGLGLLITRGSFKVMTGFDFPLDHLAVLFRSEIVILWLPGAFFGLLLFILARYVKHPLLIPAMLVISIIVFHIILRLSNISITQAGQNGLLLGLLKTDLKLVPDIKLFSEIDWPIILNQSANIIAVSLVSAMGLLFNTSSIELITNKDIDFDRELQISGLSNLIIAPFGGLIGFQSLSRTSLSRQIGGKTRLVGITAGLFCLLILFFGTNLISFLPKFVIGGLLVFIGLSLLFEWLIKSRRNLLKFDYAIVLLILVVISTAGFLQGVGVGILVSFILFALDYSRTKVIKHALSGINYRSYVDRPSDHRQILNDFGDEIYILELQGFIFFGTANVLLAQIRKKIQEKNPRFIILDYRQVIGLDSSALLSFIRLQRLAKSNKITLIFSQFDHLEQLLLGSGLNFAEIEQFSELNLAVEWCENEILKREKVDLNVSSRSLLVEYQDFVGEFDPDKFLSYFQRLECQAGDYLLKQGDQSSDIYFIEQGQVNVQVEMNNGRTTRLRKLGPGTVVGEIGHYLGTSRGASVIAAETSVVYRLTAQSLKQMERDIPGFAVYIHQSMAKLMAERLINTNQTVEALLN